MPPMVKTETPVVDKSAQRVRTMFGEIADRYDFLNHLLSLGVDKYWRWRTVRKVPPVEDGPILDVCSGTGDLALAYARKSTDNVCVVGADFCLPMLAIGAKKARRAGVADRLVFVEADALRLPFSSGRFQIVAVAFGLRNVCDTDLALREMTRVCRPGGKVAILEFSLPQRQPMRSLYRWYFRNILPWIGQRIARNRCDAYNYLPTSVEQFPSGEELSARMEGAGLSGIRIWPLTFGIATLYVGIK